MRRNLIIVGAVGMVVFGVFLIVATGGRSAGPAITIRRVNSLQSGDTTTLFFEISNHTAGSYVFFPLTVDVHSGTVWAPSYKFSDTPPIRALGPSSFINYQAEAMIVPQGVPLRFRIRVSKEMSSLEEFVRHVQESILYYRGRAPRPFSLNPFDKKSRAFGPPMEVVSEEFEESRESQGER